MSLPPRIKRPKKEARLRSAEELAERAIPEPNSGCWLWLGSINSKGYAIVWVEGKHRRAARLMWALAHGDIPAGLEVCHSCDNRLCINPDHLSVATHAENVRQVSERKRWPDRRGEKHHMRLLTVDQVRAIRADSRRHVDIAADYGVSKSTISAIKSGQNWGYVS
jgi:hypothetical protein